MANFGLSNPWVAPYQVSADGTQETYGTPIKAGEAVNTNANPKYVETKLHGDNKAVEVVKEYVSTDVTLGVTRIPVVMAEMMFGHKVTEKGTEVSNANDSAPYVGYAFITKEIEAGVTKFRGCLFPKVQMVEGEESYETKGENVQFKTPTLSGTGMARLNGDWRIKSPKYDTEQEVVEWIKAQFKLTTTATTKPADIDPKDSTK